MNIEELKRLAEAATPGPWSHREYVAGIGDGVDSDMFHVADDMNTEDAIYVAAANPAAVLELIDYVQSLESTLRSASDDLKKAQDGEIAALRQRDEARQNDYHAMAWLADCRFAVGDDGKRMLPEFVEHLKDLKRQRDELLAALKDARELVEDWGAYAPKYMQEKHDLQGDLDKLDAAIANAERQP